MSILKKLNIVFSLVSILITIASSAQVQKEKAGADDNTFYKRPKLVVGVVVDQMRYDYLVRFNDKYVDGGFRRLLKDGFSFTNANYNYVPTYTACGHTCVYTGTTPSHNGIVSNDWFNRYTKSNTYCVSDTTVSSLGTTSISGKMSPVNLLTTTIGDELKLATNFRSKVLGIALKDRGSILTAGKGADAAYWHDPYSNNFVTSTYYMKALPTWVKDFNNRKVADSLLANPWTTLLPIEQYTESSPDDSPYEGIFKGETKPVFPHNLPALKTENSELIRDVPFGNTLTKEFVFSAIQAEKMGKGSETDFLAISFTSTDYVGHMFGVNAIETEDTYLRLDRDIADLLRFLDNYVGKDEYLLFLTADHGAVTNPVFNDDHRMTGEFFEGASVMDSLKSELKRVYGEGNFILSRSTQNIYLDRDLIASKKIKLEEIQNRIAAFISNFEGVSAAMTATELQKGIERTGVYEFMQNGFNPQRSADVIVQLQPGWISWSTKTGTTHGSAYRYDTHVPMIYFGKNVRSGNSATPVNITDIAPTISTFLNIEFPSGNTGVPLQDWLK
ncbi:MAG: alkaline phosphatase family protein [Bacteroidetes bacterium]|nr:alkaline phosphatase family protein [Bacteroidota bacterium]